MVHENSSSVRGQSDKPKGETKPSTMETSNEISSITKIAILTSASALVYYIYSPLGMNFIQITKYIKTMSKTT